MFVEMLEIAIDQDSEQKERIVIEALDFLVNHPSSSVRTVLALNFQQFCYMKGRPSKEKLVGVFEEHVTNSYQAEN
ncbi:unnamed protein product [Nesidiocoris tenuis]|uniref:Uncharacterized protein n=1 Tax=Nesidiocoris tenuis TaxID=355587 RepID=A0A6H5HF04_9HEMI|nr:unnamed protein product [Nesidiocoris tenuis]CAB0014485.1 unnamed protein product [Nesidiocoris tenuis]